MDFDHFKPVLDDRAVPERRQCATAAKEWYGGPPPPLPRGQHFVLDALHGNSFLLLSLLCRLGDFSAGRSFLFNRFDDAHSHSLPHVTHSKAACEREDGHRKGIKIHTAGWSVMAESPQLPELRGHACKTNGGGGWRHTWVWFSMQTFLKAQIFVKPLTPLCYWNHKILWCICG